MPAGRPPHYKHCIGLSGWQVCQEGEYAEGQRTLGLLVVVVLSSISAAVAAQWAEYRPAKIGYAVEMPEKWTLTPVPIKSAVGDLNAVMALVVVGGRTYMAMHVPYPDDKIRGRNVAPILDAARDGAVSNVHGKLRNEERIVIGDFPARQIVIDEPNNAVVVIRFFIMGSLLVQALVEGPPNTESEPDTLRFLGSLKVVAP